MTKLANFLGLTVEEIKTRPNQLFFYVAVPDSLREEYTKLAKQLAPRSLERAEVDHITLLYIPKWDTPIPAEMVEKILTEVRGVGEKFAPISAKVQGWGYFDGAMLDGKESTALVGLVDAPGLEALHLTLKEAMTKLGFPSSKDHIFTAHTTFAYLPKGDRVDDLPVLDQTFTIERVLLANAEIHDIPLKAQQEPSAKMEAGEPDGSETPDGSEPVMGGDDGEPYNSEHGGGVSDQEASAQQAADADPEPAAEPSDVSPEQLYSGPSIDDVVGDQRRLTLYKVDPVFNGEEKAIGEVWQDEDGHLHGSGVAAFMLFEPSITLEYKRAALALDVSPLTIFFRRMSRASYYRAQFQPPEIGAEQ